MENKSQSLQKILSDDEFLKKVLTAENDKKIRQLFSDEGISLTDEQVENIKNNFRDQFLKINQIDDENFQYIAAGREDYVNAALKGGGYGGAYGMWTGAGLGALIGAIDTGFKIKNGKINSSWGVIKNILKKSVVTSVISGSAGAFTGTITSVIAEGAKK